MGEVWKAEDLKLGREVALKFLASHLVSDPEIQKRFEREAKAAASLSHPNICTVYEIDQAGGKSFLAMELVKGDSLEARIDKGPAPLKEALDIARQIAEGLQEAHTAGVVHRDIKPGNILVTPDGRAKILDFGLALLSEGSKLTKLDTTVGTVAYMSPKQGQGAEVDHRTDIWALGVVLYEMVAGVRPFKGKYDQALLYEIVQEEPEPLTGIRAGVPMELEFIVGKCLAKDSDQRYQSTADLIVDLGSLQEKLKSGKSTILRSGVSVATGTPAGPTQPAPAQQGPNVAELASIPKAQQGAPTATRERIAWAVAAGLAIALLASLFLRQTPPPERPVRKWSFAPEALLMAGRNEAVSPNGRHIVYVAGPGEPALWVRDIDREEPRRLAGTEGASRNPFWSPDSRFLGFVVKDELKKIPIDGGLPVTLCQLPGRYNGGSWSPDGQTVAFSSNRRIHEVPARGGPPKLLFEREETEKGNFNYQPLFLPLQARARSLVLSVGDGFATDVVLKNLETGESQVLAQDGMWAGYSPSGHIVFTKTGSGLQFSLWALPFSLETLQPSGEAFPIAENAVTSSVSEDGTLVFRDVQVPWTQLVWRGRDGEKLGEIGQPQQFIVITSPVISPDGRRVAVSAVTAMSATEGGNFNVDVWVREVERPMTQRLTLDAAFDGVPQWSPSGREITFSSLREGNYDIFRRAADGTGEARVLVATEAHEVARGWSRDGNYLVYLVTTAEGASSSDIWYLKRKDGEDEFESVPFLENSFAEKAPRAFARRAFARLLLGPVRRVSGLRAAVSLRRRAVAGVGERGLQAALEPRRQRAVLRRGGHADGGGRDDVSRLLGGRGHPLVFKPAPCCRHRSSDLRRLGRRALRAGGRRGERGSETAVDPCGRKLVRRVPRPGVAYRVEQKGLRGQSPDQC